MNFKAITIGSSRQWHWISGAISLVGMMLFALTGITLNHASDIPANRQVTAIEVDAPKASISELTGLSEGSYLIPRTLQHYMQEAHGVALPRNVEGEWDGIEFYASWPGPGADSWLAVDVDLALLTYEHVDRGIVAYFNDLHKGRNTGAVWRWFIDGFAIACIIFSVTGLQLLMKHATSRVSTWPVTALGVLIPFVILLLFVH